MFTDPISLTPGASFDAGAVSLPRVSQQGAISVYQAGPLSVNAGSLLRVTASHQYGKRIRRVLRCDYSDNAGATLISGTTSPRSMSATSCLTFRAPGSSRQRTSCRSSTALRARGARQRTL